MSRLLLCTDLDRTLLPNGSAPESTMARAMFKILVSRPEVTLAYVTGRDQHLVKQAITEYQLPQPDYVIADVGSSVYQIKRKQWQIQQAWHDKIKPDWRGNTRDDIHRLFSDQKQLQLQPAAKQNTYKLSYTLALDIDHQQLIDAMQQRLEHHSIAASLIWSQDPVANTGLLDVLPASADKLKAIEFLMQQQDFDLKQTLFAGDSGNDITVLCSAIPAVLVANADAKTREACLHHAQSNHQQQSLYIAQGSFMGMNGNYSAGILEGLVHFMPHTRRWLQSQDESV